MINICRLSKTAGSFLTLLLVGACGKEMDETTPQSGNKPPLVLQSTLNTELPEEAFPGRVGVLKKGVFLGQQIEYELIDGYAVIDGDILIPEEELEELGSELQRNNARTSGAGRTSSINRWPDNRVFYTLDPSLSPQARTSVNEAIAYFHANTRLKFVPWTNQTNYIRFKYEPGKGNSSYIGMKLNSSQDILLENARKGIVIHEICHALGLYHEHSRVDRDEHVTVNFNNIIYDKIKYFTIYTFRNDFTDGFDHGDFDFNSIMMYSSNAYAKIPGIPTIVRKSNGTTFISQRDSLSLGDKAILNYMYPRIWYILPGKASEISVASNGTAWMVGLSSPNIFRWNTSTSAWTQIPGSAVKLDADAQGRAWAINSIGEVSRYNGSGWDKLPGKASEIGVGAGTAWMIGFYNPNIFRWNGSGWTQIPGSATKLDVDGNGVAWIIDPAKDIYRYTGSGWQKLPGKAKDIGVGSNGIAWVVDPYNNLFRWNAQTFSWTSIPGSATELDVDSQGRAWTINSIGEVYRYKY